jgi:hypothetical protein
MDPFIEGQLWQDFHNRFINDLADLLTPEVRPRYVVEIQQYVCLAREDELPDRLVEPDLALAESQSDAEGTTGGAAAVATIAPTIYTLPVPRRYQQKFLSIRDRQSRNVVTVIELLSPWNKSLSGGSDECLAKRSDIFQTPSHLVELDLLRSGQRLATREPLAPADYYAFVCRKQRLPRAEVYAWSVRDRLPVIPVPLATGDPDVPLDLQAAFTKTYNRSGYDYSLDYHSPVEPPLDASAAEWVRSVLGT